jgi:ABC-type transport system involved in multi-copper enzyme maturation permease subunit
MTQRFASFRDLRPIAVPLYVAAFMLAAIPLVEVGAQLGFTGHPSSLVWRTGTVGLLSSALLTPAFGLILAVVTAYVFEHTVTHRILSVLSGFVAVALFVVTALFVLDAFQLRPTLKPELTRSFTLAMAKALLNFGLVSVSLLLVFIVTLRARRKDKVVRATRLETAEMPMLVRR